MSVTLSPKNGSALSRDHADELFVAWQQHGDHSARERLVQNYLPFAHRLAGRYRGAHEPIEDLRQVAAFALLKAIDGYDVDRDIAFTAYAVPTVLGELRRYFRDCGWTVHVPRALKERTVKVEQTLRTLEGRHSRVTAAMIAEYLEMSIEDVSEALEANFAHHALSFDLPKSDEDEDGATLDSVLGSEDPAYSHADTHLAPAAREIGRREESRDSFPWDAFRGLASGGLFAVPFPEPHGAGLPHSIFATCIDTEEIAYESSSMAGVYDGQCILNARALSFAQPHIQDKVLPSLISGETASSFGGEHGQVVCHQARQRCRA